jgi:tetratricopeptide (TPR) repeat protein
MSRRLLMALAVAVLGAFAAAQVQSESQQITRAPAGTVGSEINKPKALTPEQQKRGMDLLQIAEADAGGLEGGMRAWALWQIARGYERTDKKKALELLENALTATRSMEDDGSGSAANRSLGPGTTRAQLQEQILKEIVPLAPSRADDLLSQVDASGREKVLTALLAYYEKNKQTDHILEIIYRIGAEHEFPYGAASRVMEGMKPEQSAEFMQLFMAALASYRDHSPHDNTMNVGTGDFPGMVTRYWKRLPKEVVRQSIDEILKQAESPQKDGKKSGSFSLASDKGTASFGSMYEYRLFQMLPVLREIDESAAEELLKKYREVATQLEKYPDGSNSLLPQPGAPSDKKPPAAATSGMSFSIGGTPSTIGAKMAEMSRVQKLVADAEAGHAPDAMANAPSISDPDLRAQLYQGIARVTWKKQGSIATSAIDKMLDVADKLEPARQLNSYRAAADIYLQMGETDSAKKMIEKGLAIADKVYQADTNADDPNKALKAFWPSTDAYRGLLRQAGAISPAWALTLLKEISDPEVKVAAESSLAGSWLNVPMGMTIVQTSKKNGTSMRMNQTSEN